MKIAAAKLRFLGVSSRAGRREYEFAMRDHGERRFSLIVPIPTSPAIGFQEGPDLCYQKLQAELDTANDMPNGVPIWVTAEDLAHYRETHRPAKVRRWSRER